MINSAAEFLGLRTSDAPEDQHRASMEPAPIEVWEELIRDYPDMRFWVAQNKTVPADILKVLATDGDRQVRAMVARKRKLDPAVAMILAKDADEGVRMAIVSNPRMPDEVLRLLLDDPWDRIRSEVSRRLDP